MADIVPALSGDSPFERSTKLHRANPRDASVNARPFSNGPASRKSLGAQPMTHYHSLFADLLTWKNPRNSGIAYGSIVSLILAVRYLDMVRWAFKLSYLTLAMTVTAEFVGRFAFNTGLASQLRPRRYYTVSRETVDSFIGDVHELANFFVIEGQRILFAENIAVSAAACAATFISYFLVKLVPYWGLAILSTTLAFFLPLVYLANKDLIDENLKTASDVINSQTAQVRDAAQKQADQLTALGKQYAGDYTGKVQDMIRGRPAPTASSTSFDNNPKAPAVKAPDFPTAPTEEPIATTKEVDAKHLEEPEIPQIPAIPEQEPLIAA